MSGFGVAWGWSSGVGMRSLIVIAMACVAMTVCLPASPSEAASPSPTDQSATTSPGRPGTAQIGTKCLVFFIYVYSASKCAVKNRPGCFVGHAGGLSLDGFGFSDGHLFIRQANIYEATERFNVNFAVAYTNFNFLDSDSRLLGHFHGGGFPDLNVGIHGGVGNWRGMGDECALPPDLAHVPPGIRRVK